MSLCCGGTVSDGGGEAVSVQEKAQDTRLKRDMEKAEKKEDTIIKMLLLGAGESGKSTIFKQMKIINQEGYSERERKDFTSICQSNTVQSMKNLLAAFAKLSNPAVEISSEVQELADKFNAAFSQSEKILEEHIDFMERLWTHPLIQTVFLRRNEFQLNDSAEYYLKQVRTMAAPDWIPTTDDVLHSRVRTTGIVQTDFKIRGLEFCMFDVGGQRNERRKWIHCFDGVHAVVFVASLSEFDQTLYEDESQDRMSEAYSLFDQICNSKWFRQTSMILFLNKKDLFEQKLADGKIFAQYNNKMCAKDGREEYQGENTLKECADYVKQIFLDKNKNKDKSIYTHVTCATDTQNVKFVFDVVVSIILEINMKASGLI